MTDHSTSGLGTQSASGLRAPTRMQALYACLGLAVLLIALRPFLADGWVRLPQAILLPWAQWLDAAFAYVQNETPVMAFTRSIAECLGVLIDAAANLLYGKSRWPRIGPIPWSAVAAFMAVLAYALGGWRLALLVGGTFVWTALVGQWKWAMETMSVLMVAAPVSFVIGLLLGIWAWQSRVVEAALRPILMVLQTLPFFTYLLPAVIFFKVGPTAASVATIVYAMPPMILMTIVGLKNVPTAVVEAGKMAGCSRWQMMTRVYLPSARDEILVGLNQVIMLSLAMVVLTAFIGMPGLGAKLLSMMGSFKLGRSFEIGVTIVLLAVTLDRLVKAWVLQKPTHFEKGTPWWQRHRFVLIGVGAFAAFVALAQVFPILAEVGRRQSLSMGSEIDGAIKAGLAWPPLKAVTEDMRYVFNVWILVPTERALLFVPTLGVIALVTAFCLALGGWRPAAYGLAFFTAVALLGWWDRAMLTLHSVLTATLLAFLLGLPMAVLASRSAKASARMIVVCDTAQTFPSFIYLLPAIMLFGITPLTVILAILIFTMVPVVRYTIEGLRGVPTEVTEAADMAGATWWQKLRHVQLPLALPTIAVGLNQALVFAFFMVIIAAFIGTRDLGQELQRTLAGTNLGTNFTLGFSVVFMALTFDIAINAWADRRRRALGL